jgi:SPFH domain / Band 7 family
VLDDASGKWGIRVTRVEIKAIDPPKSVKDAMEKQMRAEREKRAAILTAEGVKQAKILTAEGDKQSAILTAEGGKQSAILRAEGQAQAITAVFQAVHDNDPDPKLLAYQYLQTLPQLAQGAGNTFWVIPSEVTTALRSIAGAFGGGDAIPAAEPGGAKDAAGRARREPRPVPAAGVPAIGASPAAAPSGPEAGTQAEPAPDAGASPAADAPLSADSLAAMLAAAVPGTSFADPLGAADPAGAEEPPGPAYDATAPVPVITPESDMPSANGSEAVG